MFISTKVRLEIGGKTGHYLLTILKPNTIDNFELDLDGSVHCARYSTPTVRVNSHIGCSRESVVFLVVGANS